MGPLLRGAATAVVAMAAWSIVGCEDEVDIPTGPNLTPLVEEYDSPTGTLDEENVQLVADAAIAELAKLEDLGDLDFVVSTVDATKDTVEDLAAPDGNPDPDLGGTVKVKGVAKVHTICPGITDLLDESENGSLDINVPFRESELSPVIFGAFNECLFRAATVERQPERVPVLLDAGIAANIGSGVSFNLAGLDAILYRLQGTAKIGTRPPDDIDTNFRTFKDGRVEVSVDVDDGNVVPFVNRETFAAGIRTRNMDYCCDFEGHVCIQTTSSNADCSEPASGDTTLRW